MRGKNFDSNVGLIAEQWGVLKEDLHNGVVKYDNIEKIIKNYMVFNRFDNIFKETCKFFEVNLSDINVLYRGVPEEVDLENYDRMIPKVEFAKGNNRMNPPGKAFLYAGTLGKYKGKDDIAIKKHVVKTVLKEIRATKNSMATICKFKIIDQVKNKKVLNICGDISIPKIESKLSAYILKHAFDKKRFAVDKEKLSYILANVYFNMFSSDQIFKPVNSNEQVIKKYEYAPLSMAN